MAFVKVRNKNYWVTEEGFGKPLMLLHGFTGSGANWEPHVPAFIQAGYQVIRVDLLGHGQSDAPLEVKHYYMESLAEDLSLLIVDRIGEPVHLLGYSMGGRLALYLALHYPTLCRTLILESASPGLVTAGERESRLYQDDMLATYLEENGLQKFVDRWERIPLFMSQRNLPDEKRALLRQQRLSNRVHGLANALRGTSPGRQISLWKKLEGLAMPAFLIVGEQDQKYVTMATLMETQMPDTTLQVIQGAGHRVDLEKPEQFTEAVLSWLQSIKDREAVG